MAGGLAALSYYLATIRDANDPLIAFIRAYSQIGRDEFQYYKVAIAVLGCRYVRLSPHCQAIVGLSGIASLFIAAAIGYLAGIIGRSTIVTLIASLQSVERSSR